MNFVSSHPAFNDTIDSLKNEFKDDHSNSVIICGAHDISRTESIDKYKAKYDKVIVFNQEQILTKHRNFMHLGYFTWLKDADEVWDYDDYNIQALSSIRKDIKLHILKPCNSLNSGTLEKTYDVLFYGWINNRRQVILDTLVKHGINVCIPKNVYGNNLSPYIARSKLCLNIHFYPDTALQEQARMIRWVSSNARIISETSRNNYLNVQEAPYNNLVETVEAVL